MRRSIACLLTLLCTLSMAPCFSWDELMTFTLTAGYRQDHFHVNINSFEDDLVGITDVAQTVIPIGSKAPRGFHTSLNWNAIHIYDVKATFSMATCDRIYMRGYANYGTINHGFFTDNDTFRSISTNSSGKIIKGPRSVISKSKSLANKGEVFDISAALGYQFSFQAGRAKLSPLIGYSHHEQHFRMNDLFVQLDLINDNQGRIPGFHSNYRARWFGLFLGMDLAFNMTRCLTLVGSGEYHIVRYRAQGNWNLRTDFVKDFLETTHGYGQIYNLGINYDFTFWEREWACGFLVEYQRWQTIGSQGRDRVYLQEGPVDSRLGGVKWHSKGVKATVSYFY